MTQEDTLRKLTEDITTKLFLIRAECWARKGFQSNGYYNLMTPRPEELNCLYEELKKLTYISEISLAK